MLRTIAIAAGARPEQGVVAIYGLDFGAGSIHALEVLPHVGSIVLGEDSERVQRLLNTLRGLLDERSKLFSEANASTLKEYRELVGDHQIPRIFLLIDGLGSFRSEWENNSARTAFYAIFMRVLGEGRRLGVHVIATAERYGVVPTAVSANVTRRVVLRLSDEGAYTMLGEPKDILDDRSVPGRAIINGLETQIGVIGGTANVAEQTKAMEEFAQKLRAAGAREAAEIKSLPTELDPSELPHQSDGQPVLGISDEALGPQGFSPAGTFLVAGPPQSGKTNAVMAIMASMERFDPATEFFHFGGRRAVLRDLWEWVRTVTAPEEAKALAGELKGMVMSETAKRRLVIVVENLAEFADTEADRPLRELFQAVNRSDHLVVADGDTATFAGSYGLIGELKAGRHGVALRPDTIDGEALFKVPFPKIQRHEFPPGRGIFVENGRYCMVQFPLMAGF